MPFANLDLDLLRAFVAVVDTGSFTGATRVVRRSQSAVSQKVVRLEEILQQPVFARTNRNVRLTPMGKRLLPYARSAIQANDQFLATLRHAETPVAIRLGIADELATAALMRRLARFFDQQPHMHLKLWTGSGLDLQRDYLAGKLDAFIAPAWEAGTMPGRTIRKDPMLWVAGTAIELDAPQPVRLIAFPPPCPLRAIMIETLDAARKSWVEACVVNSLSALESAIIAGLGATIISRPLLRDDMRILEGWPVLPAMEIVLFGEDPSPDPVLARLAAFLAEQRADDAHAQIAMIPR
jgi:DNA-binding transcriptional LysR family regulator